MEHSKGTSLIGLIAVIFVTVIAKCYGHEYTIPVPPGQTVHHVIDADGAAIEGDNWLKDVVLVRQYVATFNDLSVPKWAGLAAGQFEPCGPTLKLTTGAGYFLKKCGSNHRIYLEFINKNALPFTVKVKTTFKP
jgi:hypothetical protein